MAEERAGWLESLVMAYWPLLPVYHIGLQLAGVVTAIVTSMLFVGYVVVIIVLPIVRPTVGS